MVSKQNSSSLVIFSGGQDSTTCLLWALKRFDKITTITFNYKQRHQAEIGCAQKIIDLLNSSYRDKLKWLKDKPEIEHMVIDISFLSNILSSSMIQELEMKLDTNTNLPSTFVPGRNILFLTIAAAIAYQKQIKHIVIGVCQTDFSGYPDCRDVTIKSVQVALRLGLDYDVIIHTPLMWRTKAETIKLMLEVGDIEILEFTHTCYSGERPACGVCDSCKLRIKGFREVGIEDPLKYKLN